MFSSSKVLPRHVNCFFTWLPSICHTPFPLSFGIISLLLASHTSNPSFLVRYSKCFYLETSPSLLVFIMAIPFHPCHLHTKCSVHSTYQPCYMPSSDWESHLFPIYLTSFAHSSNSMQAQLTLSSLQPSSPLSECIHLFFKNTIGRHHYKV